MRSARGTDPVLTDRLVLTPVGVNDVGELLRLYSEPQIGYWTELWTPSRVVDSVFEARASSTARGCCGQSGLHSRAPFALYRQATDRQSPQCDSRPEHACRPSYRDARSDTSRGTLWSPPRLNDDVAPAQGIDPVLTDRLLLTPVSGEDTDELERLYSDPLVRYWTGPWTPASVEAWARGMEARWADEGVGKWMAHDGSTGTLVGRGGLSRTVLDGKTVLEVGWVVRDELTGHGYATEIGQAALGWAATFFPELPVVAFTEVHNLASVAVMRRLGLYSSGVIRREGLIAGQVGLQPEAPFALYRQSAQDRASP